MPQYFGKLPTTNQPWTNIGALQSFQSNERGVCCQAGESNLAISVLAPNLIRVRLAPSGEFMPRRSWAVALDDGEWPTVEFEFKETLETLQIETAQMRVSLQKNPCRIQCFDKNNSPFASDTEIGMGWRMGAVAAWKKIEADEHFYGFGERTGFLDKLSEVKTTWARDALDYGSLTDEMYQAIPVFIALRSSDPPNPPSQGGQTSLTPSQEGQTSLTPSQEGQTSSTPFSKGGKGGSNAISYGIFFNTTFWSQFDIGAETPGVLRMETRGDELDYYIIYGPEPAQILYTYTQLTGRIQLPPKWALGYHQCRWSYESEKVVRELAQEFRQRQIPCDVIHLDIDYMRGYRVFTWSPKRFPDPAKLIGDLKQNGFKTVTIIDPGVKYEPEADYHVFDEGIKNDYFVRKPDGQLFHGYVWPDKAVFPDFMRSDVQKWWGDLQKSLTDIGVAGIWNDMNEPALDDRPFGEFGNKIWFPLDAPQGDPSDRATHLETHNLYGLSMAKACYEGLQRQRFDRRPFVISRSGFAGIQRWSCVWTGDNQSLWEYLEMSLPMLCNMGLSGVPFVGCDIGGFAGNATAELFARWMQVGMLYPFMRGHSAMSTARHEPWVFGERVENICREYINLRYQLLPYIYTLFWEAATTGAPILRPLVYHFPNDIKTYNLYDQVLLGSSIMAAPIYRSGLKHRAVYLPAGIWYDWWSGDRYEGPIHILAHAPLERMPLYVRAGAIIPIAPIMQYTDERLIERLTVRIWPGNGEFTLYEDDGNSVEYKAGISATTTYRVRPENENIIVEIDARQGQFSPASRQVIVEVIGTGEQEFQDDGMARQLEF